MTNPLTEYANALRIPCVMVRWLGCANGLIHYAWRHESHLTTYEFPCVRGIWFDDYLEELDAGVPTCLFCVVNAKGPGMG